MNLRRLKELIADLDDDSEVVIASHHKSLVEGFKVLDVYEAKYAPYSDECGRILRLGHPSAKDVHTRVVVIDATENAIAGRGKKK